MNRIHAVVVVAAGCVLLAACTGTEGGTPSATSPDALSNPTSTPGSTTKSTSPTNSASGLLDDVDVCGVLNPSTLPPSWGTLTVDANPSVKLGDSACDLFNQASALAISLNLYLGPGRGVQSLITTISAPIVDSVIAGRPVKTFDDAASTGACGVLFDFGTDQAITVVASAPVDNSLKACDIANTAATAMAPNLPPS